MTIQHDIPITDKGPIKGESYSLCTANYAELFAEWNGTAWVVALSEEGASDDHDLTDGGPPSRWTFDRSDCEEAIEFFKTLQDRLVATDK